MSRVLPRIADIKGWILICKDEDEPGWHIAWAETFTYKREALLFAEQNKWPKPYRAVRGRLLVDHQ